MSNPLPILTDEQVQASLPTDDEPGFGSLATERGHLPLVAMDVQARIDGLLSQVDLRQTFANTLDEALEATYIFPLPDRAAVTAMARCRTRMRSPTPRASRRRSCYPDIPTPSACR